MYKINKLIRNKKFIEYFLLTLILLTGFLVRLYKIDSPLADWHSWRQADTASVTRIYIDQGINLLYPRYYDISSIQSRIINPNGYRFVEFPFYNAISAIAFNLAPVFSLEVWSRLVSVSFAVISAIFIYLIGKRVMGTASGILSAFFFLFIPYNIYFTRVILPEPFGVAALMAGIWFYLQFIDKGSVKYLFVSGFFLAISLLIKPFFAFYFLPLAYLAFKKYGFNNIFKDRYLRNNFLAFTALLIVPFIAWRIWEGMHPEGIPLFAWAFNEDGIRFRPAFWRWIFSERLGTLILGVWGLVPFIFGILKPEGKNLFVKYSAFAMLLYVLVVATANVKHDYYQIMTIPMISWVMASGSVYLWTNNVFNQSFTRILVVFSVLMMLMVGWLLIKENYKVNHPEIIEAGMEIDRTTPKDAIVVAPYNGDTAFLYQTKRFGWPVLDNSIDNIIKQGASYYVSVDLHSADTTMIASRFKTVKKTDTYIIIDLTQPIE